MTCTWKHIIEIYLKMFEAAQDDIAYKLGIDKSTVSRLRSGTAEHERRYSGDDGREAVYDNLFTPNTGDKNDYLEELQWALEKLSEVPDLEGDMKHLLSELQHGGLGYKDFIFKMLSQAIPDKLTRARETTITQSVEQLRKAVEEEALFHKLNEAAQNDRLNNIETMLSAITPESLRGNGTADEPPFTYADIPADNPVVRLLESVRIAERSGDYVKGLSDAQEALSLSESLCGSDSYKDLLIALAQERTAHMLMQSQRHDDAWSFAEKAVRSEALKRDADSYRKALITKANTALFLYKLPEARGTLNALDAMGDNSGDIDKVRMLKARLMRLAGNVKSAIGLMDENINYYLAKIETETDMGKLAVWKQNYAVSLNEMGTIHRNSIGDCAAACEWFKKASDAAKDSGFARERLIFTTRYADMLGACGRSEESVALLIEVEKQLAVLAIPEETARVQYLLGMGYMGLDRPQPETAELWYEKCAQNTGSRKLQFDAYKALADVYALNKKPDNAKESNRQALTIAKTIGDRLRVRDIEDQRKRLQKASWETSDYESFSEGALSVFLPYDEETEISADQIFKAHNFDFKAASQSKEFGALSELVRKRYRNHPAAEMLERPRGFSNDEIAYMIQKAENTGDPVKKTGLYIDISNALRENDEKARAADYLEKAAVLSESISHIRVKAAVRLAQAYDLMGKETACSDEDAGQYIAEAYLMVKGKQYYELEACCEWYAGQLAARKSDAKTAKAKMNSAMRALAPGNAYNDRIADKISSDIEYLEQLNSLSKAPKLDLIALTSQLLNLECWYPKYKRHLRGYWLFSQGIEILRAIAAQRLSKCTIVTDSYDRLGELSEIFSAYFDIQSYTARRGLKDMLYDFFPVPNNLDFPCTVAYAVRGVGADKDLQKITFKQTDGSKRPLPYTLHPHSNPGGVGFDMTRTPPPMVMSYIGCDLPEIIYQAQPACYTYRNSHTVTARNLFVPPLNAGCEERWAERVLSMCSRIGTLPVFALSDIASAENVSVVYCRDIRLPYYDVKPTDGEPAVIFRKIHAAFRKAAASLTGEEHTELLNQLCDEFDRLPCTDMGYMEVQAAVLKFPKRFWYDGPYSMMTYPVLLLLPRPHCIGKSKLEQRVIHRRAEIIARRTDAIRFEDIGEIRTAIEDLSALRTGRFSGDAAIAVEQARCLERIAKLYADNEKIGKDERVSSLKAVLDELNELRSDGFSDDTAIAATIGHVYYMISGLTLPDVSFSFAGLKELWSDGFESNEVISFALAAATAEMLRNRLSADAGADIELLRSIQANNASSERINLLLAQAYGHCRKNGFIDTAERLIGEVEGLQSDDPAILLSLEIYRIYLHDPAEKLQPKLTRIKTMMNKLEDNISFIRLLADVLEKIIDKLSAEDIESAAGFLEKSVKDKYNAEIAYKTAFFLYCVTFSESDEHGLKRIAERIEKIGRQGSQRNIGVAVYLANAYYALLKSQSFAGKKGTLALIKALCEDSPGFGMMAQAYANALVLIVSDDEADPGLITDSIGELTRLHNQFPGDVVIAEYMVQGYFYSSVNHRHVPLNEAYGFMKQIKAKFNGNADKGGNLNKIILTTRHAMACLADEYDDAEIKACEQERLELFDSDLYLALDFAVMYAHAIKEKSDNPELAVALFDRMDRVILGELDFPKPYADKIGFAYYIVFCACENDADKQSAILDRMEALFGRNNEHGRHYVLMALFRLAENAGELEVGPIVDSLVRLKIDSKADRDEELCYMLAQSLCLHYSYRLDEDTFKEVHKKALVNFPPPAKNGKCGELSFKCYIAKLVDFHREFYRQVIGEML